MCMNANTCVMCTFICTYTFMQKLRNRIKQFQLEHVDWSAQRKERIKFVLSKGLEYVSSEESGDDDKILYRRPLMWLKKKYHKSLRHLDNIHYNSLSGKGKQMYRFREDGELSSRPPPLDAPRYLLQSANNTIASAGNDSLDSSISIEEN